MQYRRAITNDKMDEKFGFQRYTDPQPRMGWLINMHPVRKLLIVCTDHFNFSTENAVVTDRRTERQRMGVAMNID